MDDVLDFIRSLSIKEQSKVLGAIDRLGNQKFDEIYVKHLLDNIRELKVKRYRLFFFVHQNEVYFIRMFLKKTNKTPKSEIELVLKFYQSFIRFNKNI